jgi:hypothetical protein
MAAPAWTYWIYQRKYKYIFIDILPDMVEKKKELN